MVNANYQREILLAVQQSQLIKMSVLKLLIDANTMILVMDVLNPQSSIVVSLQD